MNYQKQLNELLNDFTGCPDCIATSACQCGECPVFYSWANQIIESRNKKPVE